MQRIFFKDKSGYTAKSMTKLLIVFKYLTNKKTFHSLYYLLILRLTEAFNKIKKDYIFMPILHFNVRCELVLLLTHKKLRNNCFILSGIVKSENALFKKCSLTYKVKEGHLYVQYQHFPINSFVQN